MTMRHSSPSHRLSIATAITLLLSTSLQYETVQASAIAPCLTAATKTRRSNHYADVMEVRPVSSTAVLSPPSSAVAEASAQSANDAPSPLSSSSDGASTGTASSNPAVQLLSYVKDSILNFKNGLTQMNNDHRRCNSIRQKQTLHAKAAGTTRPRGIRGIQTGGISYAEYDFLRKGLVDRNKLLAVTVVMLCLPNYFVYYLWSFPDMLPSPFLTKKNAREISRERCHAVLSTMLDMERGARVPPFSSKLNPFGKKGAERNMERLSKYADVACQFFVEEGAVGPAGGKIILEKLRSELYTNDAPTKQQSMLMPKYFPKHILKGLGKVIGADPLNKGSSPFGIGPLKHIESVSLADEFLVRENIDVDSIESHLLEEACSARLIGGPGWTDAERKEGLVTWLQEVEVRPKEVMIQKEEGCFFNGNLARAILMCYNAVDAVRDGRSDSRLARMMFQGQKMGGASA
ncbi:hypothetical protein HJC23_005107 [Cyclotella cryptica]|uniref:Letm1 RBD domain-containing protein n=1 Tax=Cyclotella cryptica TaxID=29204 RepID=A0ABD3QEU0_9STRA|eukprot:CCRYP_005786-RA/>CCRYP_005786-RA protein AED:0.09 eAED:0.09 QI:0/-1/0/1/-1/1/1/0/460